MLHHNQKCTLQQHFYEHPAGLQRVFKFRLEAEEVKARTRLETSSRQRDGYKNKTWQLYILSLTGFRYFLLWTNAASALCLHTHTQLLAKPQLEKKTSTMTLKNEIVHSAIIRFPLLLCRNNKCNRSHMHGISDQEIIKTHFHPQTKNCNDPRCDRWWAAALKVITEIKRSLTHTSAENQNASEALQLSKTFIMSLPTCKSACGGKWQQGKGANRWKV